MAKREVNPTFIIGLGGVGNKVVRLVRERFLATSEKGVLPPTVLLRSIDTTNQPPSWADPLPEKMFTNIGNFDADDVVNNLESYQEINRWYKYAKGEFAPGFVSSGAKAKRPVGRICFFHQFNRIKTALESDFAVPKSIDLRERLMREQEIDVSQVPQVFLVGSIAGGTCSGMFIDAAFAARRMLMDLGYHGIQVIGIFALPSVIHADSKDEDTDMALQRRINAMGALQELDFLMRSWDTGSFELDYPRLGRFAPVAPLFNQMFLMGRTKEDGVRFESGKDIMIRQAHFLYSMASASIGGDVTDIMVNVPEKVDPSQRLMGDGQIGVYCTFGTEWLEIPMDELVLNYSGSVGQQLSKALGEPRALPGEKEIQQEFLGRLPQEFAGIGRGLELMRRPKESLITFKGLEGLSGLLQTIQTSEKKNEVKQSLQDFLGAFPAAMANLRRALSVRSSSDLEEVWLQEAKHEWIGDPEIGIPGTVHFMKQAEKILEKLNVDPRRPSNDVDDVVEQCGGGLMRKCNPDPAYDYALERLAYEVKSTVRGELGEIAGRLSVKLGRESGQLANLAETLRLKMANLTMQRTTKEEIPREMWKIDPADIDGVITGSAEDFLDEVTRTIQTRIVDGLLATGSGWDLWNNEELENYLNNLAVDAIRYVASKKINPPADLVDRLKRRMAACYPMADVDQSGSPLYRQFLGTDESGAPSSIKIVSSNVEGATREELMDWAQQEKIRANSNHAFQAVQSGDPSRDDLINVSLGWPLWLFREVRSDWDRVEKVRTSKPGRYRFSLVMNEIPGALDHSFRPMESSELKELFGVALVLEHVKVTGSMKSIEFDTAAFSHYYDGVVNRGSGFNMFQDTQKRFVQGGLARNYQQYLAGRQADPEGITALREAIISGLQRRREMLEGAREQIERELFDMLSGYYQKAEEYAQRLVVL
jgi:hypothetical protein